MFIKIIFNEICLLSITFSFLLSLSEHYMMNNASLEKDSLHINFMTACLPSGNSSQANLLSIDLTQPELFS